jgi:hypothetical protein
MNSCSCVEIVKEFTESIKNLSEQQIYNIVKYLVSDIIFSKEEIDSNLVNYISQNIYILDSILKYNGNIVLSYLQTLTKEPLLYEFASIYFNLILLNQLIEEYDHLLLQTYNLCISLAEELSKKGKLDKYYSKIIKNKQIINRIQNNLILNKNLLYINQISNTIENIYNDLCLSVKGEDLPNLTLLLNIGENLGKLTILYSKIITLINNIKNINLNFNVQDIKINNIINSTIINLINSLLEWNDNIFIMCSKLEILKNILKNVKFGNKSKTIFKLPNFSKISRLIKDFKKQEDFYKWSVGNMQNNIKSLKCNTIQEEINSMKIIRSYINTILNEFYIFNDIPFIKDYINFYKNIIDSISDFDIVNNIIDGNLEKIFQKENPLISFLNLDKILKCYQIPLDDKLISVSKFYLDIINKGDDIINNAFIKYLKIQDKLFQFLKFNLNINIDSILNIIKKINNIKNESKKIDALKEHCL